MNKEQEKVKKFFDKARELYLNSKEAGFMKLSFTEFTKKFGDRLIKDDKHK